MTALPTILAQAADSEIDLHLTLPGVLAVAVGILILVMPRLLNYLVAFYLIAVGLILIFDITI